RIPPAVPIQNSSMDGSLTAWPKSLGEHCCNFRASELNRQRQTLVQASPNLSAAQAQTLLGAVTAAFLARHRPAAATVVDFVEEKRLDAKAVAGKALEQTMRVEGTVVVPHSSVVAPHDEVCAAEVLAHQGMEHRLTRPAVAHPCGQHPKQYMLRGQIVI